jgi:hypothetical protein
LSSGGTNKTTPPLKRGKASQKKDASNKHPKTTRKSSSSKKVNVSQPKVDRHQVDMINPRSSPHVHTTEQAGASKDPDSFILRNHDEFHGVQEISINYTSSRELLDRTIMVVNTCFSTMVADLLNDTDPKIMAECKQRSNLIKWKEAIDAELDSLRKREIFSNVIPTPPKTYHVGFKWGIIQKWNENNEVVRYKVKLVAQGFT